MAKKFLSFLGTGDYKECIYKFNNLKEEQCKSNFIQEALIKTACKDWNKDDKAIIFLTDLAREENWYNKTITTKRLKSNLENTHIEVNSVSIPDGKTEEEIWEIFDIVSSEIDEDDEIIFDITHSFRSIPMLALVVLNYVKVIKNAKILGIYYGAWEAKDENDIAPIFDLTPMDEILEWSQAVNTFLRYGNSGHLKDLSFEVLRPRLPFDQWARDTRTLIDKLDDFTMGVYTCRGLIVEGKKASKKSISVASKEVKDSIKRLKEHKEERQLKPLIPLISSIENSVERFSDEDNLKSGIATVEWAIENKLIQQAYTALDETIKTYVCVKYDLNPTNNDHRENIAQTALKVMGSRRPEKEWKIKKEYEEQVKDIAYSLDEDLIILSQKITEKRNDINHFGFKEDVSASDSFSKQIKECYEDFIVYLEKQGDI